VPDDDYYTGYDPDSIEYMVEEDRKEAELLFYLWGRLRLLRVFLPCLTPHFTVPTLSLP
jgi:hypothetical protein